MDKLVYFSLGSNLGDRQRNLKAAIKRLESLGRVLAVSSFYETEPVSSTPQPWFLNCALALETEKMPRQLLSAIQNIEQEMGRLHPRKKNRGPRTIDIDILFFGKSIMNTRDLHIPHPDLHKRRFVLEPLAEIAAEHRHPVFKCTVRELRDALAPGQSVRKLNQM